LKKCEAMDMPKRKRNRLTGFDYSTPGVYFITFCTKDRKNLLWENVEASIVCLEDVVLSAYGRITENAINSIPQHYPAVRVNHYVIMPNHIHLLLQIESDIDGRPMVAPTIYIYQNMSNKRLEFASGRLIVCKSCCLGR